MFHHIESITVYFISEYYSNCTHDDCTCSAMHKRKSCIKIACLRHSSTVTTVTRYCVPFFYPQVERTRARKRFVEED